MLISIEIHCPHCHSQNVRRNGKKSKGKQNFICKKCGRPFISGHERTYIGAWLWVKNIIKIMLVRGMGIRDGSAVLNVSITPVLKVLKSTKYKIKPKQDQYDRLEIDEFWTYVGKKQNNVWLIYVYHRDTGELVAFVGGETGPEDGFETEKADKTAGNKL